MVDRIRNDEARRAAYRRGLHAETLAVWMLRLRGFRILDRRARTPVGEIDIVARRGELVLFIEVKRRSELHTAFSSLRLRQQERIVRAARFWLAGQAHLSRCNYRFDMVIVPPYLWPLHIADAFPADIAGQM